MAQQHHLIDQLRESSFGGEILTGPAARTVYSTDNSIYQVEPLAVVVPATVEDIVTLVRLNSSLDRPLPLVARGGGTGTNGQSLADGVVVDTRRHLNRIISVDTAAREAVVEPGVVLGQLNTRLARDGLFFAPHVATETRATIGGMVATDAAGKGSLVYGRTNDHVLSISTVLDDGTPWEFGTITESELRALASRNDRVGDVHRGITEALEGLDPSVFPTVARQFTGYNLADAMVVDGIDTTKLLCGSEGTLALTTSVRVRLTPKPSDVRMAVVVRDTFDAALAEAYRLRATQPIAIETLDERTLSLANASRSFGALTDLVDVSSGAALILEYDGDEGLSRLRAMVEAAPDPRWAATADPDVIAAVWQVRKDAVGILGQAVEGRRSIPFVEDCAVPPDRLQEFAAAYRTILDRHGLSYGIFGHADVGCLHVRPALDLYDPSHEALIRTISDEVAGLVDQFGGVFWGEHGRGFRGEYATLDPETMHRMRQVKTAFDPRDVFNPGKMYRPLEVSTPLARIDGVPLRVHSDRSVARADRERFATAFDCNGNGICHHWDSTSLMCPSFKATLDPALSPKGRADLIRAWLAKPGDSELASQVADSLHKCLSCSACTGTCPVSVDIPELKSRFFAEYRGGGKRRRMREAFLSRLEWSLPTFVRTVPWGTKAQRLVSVPLERSMGIVDLPEPSGESPLTIAKRLGLGEVSDATVIIVPDAFTSYLEPRVLDATVRVLRAIGERPAISEFVPSGKFDHVKGRRKQFRAAVAKRRAQIEALATSGVPMVVIEPAVALLEQHEYPAIDPGYPSGLVTPLARFLETRFDRLPVTAPSTEPVQLLGHCAEDSLAPEHSLVSRRLLEAVGYEVNVPAVTCCGMAGIFGHERENLAMSRDVFDLSWRKQLDGSGEALACAPGYSCRSQVKRFSSRDIAHPIELVASRLASR